MYSGKIKSANGTKKLKVKLKPKPIMILLKNSPRSAPFIGKKNSNIETEAIIRANMQPSNKIFAYLFSVKLAIEFIMLIAFFLTTFR